MPGEHFSTRVNYTGPDPSVECAYPPCRNRLRRSAVDGPQWCSKEHRDASEDSSTRLNQQVPADLLRRALRNHDRIAAALRTGGGGKRLFAAIDDMRALKAEAAELGCYDA